MSNELIFIVEDDPISQELLCRLLNEAGRIECFPSAEDCYQRLTELLPDLILLDIGLPGMDGYSFSKLVNGNTETQHIPIIFVSGRDTLEERLASYDAGGHDFIVKPFEPNELVKKVAVALKQVNEQKDYRQQLTSADELTSLALASMDEAGIVLQFMSKLIGYERDIELAEGFLELLGRLGVSGTVQVRVGKRELTLSKEGRNNPLEASICNHLRTLDRIFEFKRRAAFNYERLTVLINMPDSPEACGRIRDNVAMAAQGAESRLTALTIAEAREDERRSLLETLDALRGTFISFRDSYKSQRLKSSELVFNIERDLTKAFVHLGLTTGQEHFLEDMLRSRLAELLDLADKGGELEGILGGLLERLEMLTQRGDC